MCSFQMSYIRVKVVGKKEQDTEIHNEIFWQVNPIILKAPKVLSHVCWENNLFPRN